MKEDWISEAKAMADEEDCQQAEEAFTDFMNPEELSQHRQKMLSDHVYKLKFAYQKAKEAKVGQDIRCPCCNRKYVKRSHQHVFCSPKGAKSHKCKDRYWNTIDPIRRARAIDFARD